MGWGAGGSEAVMLGSAWWHVEVCARIQEKEERKKKKEPRPNRRAGKRVVNVFPFSCFFSFCSFHNEGKQSVSQNDFKTISGSVEWR